MAKEKITWQNPNFRVIDGTGEGIDVSKDPSNTSLVDRVMDEIGDTLPFEIIEGGRLKDEDIVRKPEATIIFLDSYRQSQILPESKTSKKNRTVLSKFKSFIKGFKK